MTGPYTGRSSKSQGWTCSSWGSCQHNSTCAGKQLPVQENMTGCSEHYSLPEGIPVAWVFKPTVRISLTAVNNPCNRELSHSQLPRIACTPSSLGVDLIESCEPLHTLGQPTPVVFLLCTQHHLILIEVNAQTASIHH